MMREMIIAKIKGPQDTDESDLIQQSPNESQDHFHDKFQGKGKKKRKIGKI